MRPLFALCLMLIATATLAEEAIVLGLSQDEVAITATFDGSDILIFGAVRRDAPLPPGPPLEVAITVSGPQLPLTVRLKERVFGIWINTSRVEIDAAPSFYAVATSAALRDTISYTEDLRHSISVGQTVRSIGNPEVGAIAYSDALIRIQNEQQQYMLLEGGADFEQETLFRASIALPANLIEGDYVTRIFLTRDGAVVDRYDTTITVRKVGLERWLYNLAHEHAAIYGLLSLALAVLAGWSASAVFQVFRR
ncbi:MAG: TIGR02186 family protein [Rhodobacteraceae bacterium]|nr:TIGR02186 family protein [Paracoccaceae bacterium]